MNSTCFVTYSNNKSILDLLELCALAMTKVLKIDNTNVRKSGVWTGPHEAGAWVKWTARAPGAGFVVTREQLVVMR